MMGCFTAIWIAGGTLKISCYLHPPYVTRKHTRTHAYTHNKRNLRRGDINSILGDGCGWRTLTFGTRIVSLLSVSFLPSSLGENNYGAGAAFEGGLNGSDSHSLWGVSGQLGVPPQLLEQFSVEGGCLGLPCYLSTTMREGWGSYSQSHTTTTTAHPVIHTTWSVWKTLG